MGSVQHQIGGRARSSVSGKTFATFNPATGQELVQVCAGDEADVEAAVEAAELGASTWAATPVATRSRLMQRWADLIEETQDELATLDVKDTGKPYAVAFGSVGRAADMLRWYAGWAPTIRGATIPINDTELTYTTHAPYGVVAAIIPWNYPASNFATKVAPILACGNSVIVKPAEQAPLVPLRLAELANDAGIPPGVVNVVAGDGPSAGAALATHRRIKKVAFTGSTVTGLSLIHRSGPTVKSFTLELGGKTASLVFDNADLDAAAEAVVNTSFINSGQTCTAGSRVLVQENVHDALMDRVVARTEQLHTGDPLDPSTHIGALISEEQLARVTEYADLGKVDGTVLVGGRRLQPNGLEHGWYFEPTVIDEIGPTSRLFREEIFGPLLTVTTFSTFEEGLALANDSDYGLAATVWGTDPRQLREASQRLDAGIIWVNTVHRLHPGVPYAGWRQSGVGTELGTEAQYEYTQTKTVWQGDQGWSSPWS